MNTRKRFMMDTPRVMNFAHMMTTSFRMEDVIRNSYRNFHSKGLDYLCLIRLPSYTVKVYFFDGDVSKLPEVVNPHDHRYQFRTTVLSGRMFDYRFQRDETGLVYQAFDYLTPLNGGAGFTYRGMERLKRLPGKALFTGDSLVTEADHLHTIRMAEDQTVIMLEQFEDLVPIDAPTSCWALKGEPKPDTTGLYDKFTEDQVIERMSQIAGLVNRFRKATPLAA